jgi:hypothetical protein
VTRCARLPGGAALPGWTNPLCPPFYDHEIAGIAKLFGTTQQQVRAMITEEWFGIAPDEVSNRVRRLAPQINGLEEGDFELVEALVNRLSAAKPPTEGGWSARRAKQ